MQLEDYGIIGSAILGFLTLVGWQRNSNSKIYERINKTDKELYDHKIDDVKAYATRADLKDSVDELKSILKDGFKSIENKLDRKADK